MLSLHQFQKRYQQHLILEIGSLDLPPGAYWIQGENGSGKSTLFKAIAGLIPFEGSICYNDLDNRKHRVAFHQRLGFAEAEPAFPEVLTGRDLVAFAAATKHVAQDEYAALTAAFGIELFYDQAIRTYSTGMLKKLSIALALLGQPELIILDEPYITLDRAGRETLDDILRKRLERGGTLLFSSHQEPTANGLPVSACFRISAKQLVRL